MLVKKADDYQSWYIEEVDYGILIDPWLDNKLNPYSSFFLQRKRHRSHSLEEREIEKVKAIIITAPFADHLHVPSLKQLGQDRIIYSTKTVRKILKKQKINNLFKQIEDIEEIGPFSFSSFPAGFPYNRSAFSLLISNENGKSVYHEGHNVNLKQLKKNRIKSDVAIITAESVKFLGLLELSMDESRALKIADALKSKKLMLTGTKPHLTKGLVSRLLKIKRLDPMKFENSDIKVFSSAGDKVQI